MKPLEASRYYLNKFGIHANMTQSILDDIHPRKLEQDFREYMDKHWPIS